MFTLIVHAVEKLHSINVTHGDLKPENIFLTNNCFPVIGGYSNSMHIGELYNRKQQLSLGTEKFRAPEIAKYNKLVVDHYDSMSADVFGLGHILYNLLTLKPYNGTESLYFISPSYDYHCELK